MRAIAARSCRISSSALRSGRLPFFGMLADRFGVTWIVGVAAEYTQA
ncbi:hypothetical protein ACIBQ0_03690 [Nocardia nova]